MKRVATALIITTAATALVSCGSSTVTDEQVHKTIAPITRAAAPKSTTMAATSSAAAPTSQASESVAPGVDQPAKRVESIPSLLPAELSEKDRRYLEELTKAGIVTEGIENQMIGSAQVVCGDTFPAAVQAVAGQLLEQQRTKLPVEQVAQLLEQAARNHYC